MDYEGAQVTLEMPEPYASALEYAAAQLHITQGEAVVLLLQLACVSKVNGEFLEVGKEIYNWLTIIKQVPTEEVSLS